MMGQSPHPLEVIADNSPRSEVGDCAQRPAASHGREPKGSVHVWEDADASLSNASFSTASASLQLNRAFARKTNSLKVSEVEEPATSNKSRELRDAASRPPTRRPAGTSPAPVWHQDPPEGTTTAAAVAAGGAPGAAVKAAAGGQGPTSGGATPAGFHDRLLQQLREQQEGHERRLEELLQAHEGRLEDALCRLLPGSNRAGASWGHSVAGNAWSVAAAADESELHLPRRGSGRMTHAYSGGWGSARRVSAQSAVSLQTEICRSQPLDMVSWRKSDDAASPSRRKSSFSHSETEEEDPSPAYGKRMKKPWFGPDKRSYTRDTFRQSVLYKKDQDLEEFQKKWSAAARPSEQSSTEGSCSKSALWLVSHSRFELVLAVAIVLNAASIGLQADWSIRNPGTERPIAFDITDYLFTLGFTAELLLRVLGEGTSFVSCRNKHVRWNFFDTLLVLSAITEDLVGLFVTFDAGITSIRLLRVLRLARAIRLIRVLRFFKDLRIMVMGITHSLKPLLWASSLLLIIIYVYAICLLQVVGDHLMTKHSMTPKQIEALRSYYGSLVLAVYTLFGCISGGFDWADVAEPLLYIHPIMGVLNVIYVGFAVFCVLNVITGVFVENASKLNSEDEDRVVLEMLEAKKKWIHEVKELFKLADTANTGLVDVDSFEEIVGDVRCQAIFHRLGLEIEQDSAALLFGLLDFGNNGSISLDDFAEGIQRVRGSARSIDICQLMHDMRVMKGQLTCLLQEVENAKDPQGDCAPSPDDSAEV